MPLAAQLQHGVIEKSYFLIAPFFTLFIIINPVRFPFYDSIISILWAFWFVKALTKNAL